jgi:lactate 2-monooxygenase
METDIAGTSSTGESGSGISCRPELSLIAISLYRPISKDFTLSLLSRAKASGYTALVVTLDTFSLGFRPRDLENAYLPFLKGEGCQMYFSDPVFMKKHGEDHTDTKWNGPGESPIGVEAQSRDETQKYRLLELSMAALAETSRGHFFTWEDVAFLRENWKGPLVLKGIQTAEKPSMLESMVSSFQTMAVDRSMVPLAH